MPFLSTDAGPGSAPTKPILHRPSMGNVPGNPIGDEAITWLPTAPDTLVRPPSEDKSVATYEAQSIFAAASALDSAGTGVVIVVVVVGLLAQCRFIFFDWKKSRFFVRERG